MNENEKKLSELLNQYKEYLKVNNELDNIKQKKLEEASLIAKKEKLPLTLILKERKKYPTLDKLESKEIGLKEELDNISDSMFYPNHIVWMMYKHKAYQNTPQAINNWLDLKNHCSPKDYICTKRFIFLKKYIKEKYNIDIADVKYFPNELVLKEAHNGKIMIDLLNDKKFIEIWKSYEYYKKDGKVAKWKNYQE